MPLNLKYALKCLFTSNSFEMKIHLFTIITRDFSVLFFSVPFFIFSKELQKVSKGKMSFCDLRL